MSKVEEAARQKRRKMERAKESRRIGKDRMEGRTKVPKSSWEEDELMAEIWEKTCNREDLQGTMDEVNKQLFDGGTFFHLYYGDWVVMWLSEGFWRLVEDGEMEIDVGEGWNTMDNIMEADNKKVVGKSDIVQ